MAQERQELSVEAMLRVRQETQEPNVGVKDEMICFVPKALVPRPTCPTPVALSSLITVLPQPFWPRLRFSNMQTPFVSD